MYTVLEFDFKTDMKKIDEHNYGRVVRESAYEPLLDILKIYNGTDDYNEFKQSLSRYIDSAGARIERSFGVRKDITIYGKNNTEIDVSKNL